MAECLLYDEYPKLSNTITREELGCWPTPLQPLENLSHYLGVENILVKRDDLSNLDYGGNKIRKLELILGQAKQKGRRVIITAGGLGSHHVLATAALGKQFGFRIIGLFFCQPVTERVRHNLLLNYYFGTEMYFVKDYFGLFINYMRFYLDQSFKGHNPLLLMPGGSNSISTLGYVNCLLEIRQQLIKGGYREPEALFTAAGTGGTAAGLLAGLAIAGFENTKLHAVRVVKASILSPTRIIRLAEKSISLLKNNDFDSKTMNLKLLGEKLYLEKNYLGEGYGFSNAEAREAVKLFREMEGIELEECYTAKAAAALIAYCRNNRGGNRGPLIFVHTASTTHNRTKRKLSDPKELPAAFHWCFSGEARQCRCGLTKQNGSFCKAISQPGWRWPE